MVGHCCLQVGEVLAQCPNANRATLQREFMAAEANEDLVTVVGHEVDAIYTREFRDRATELDPCDEGLLIRELLPRKTGRLVLM